MKSNYFKPAVIALLILLNVLFTAIYLKTGNAAKTDPESIEFIRHNAEASEIAKMDAQQDADVTEKAKQDALQDAEATEKAKQDAIADASEIEKIKNSIK